jgi:Fe-S-cluster containining protein
MNDRDEHMRRVREREADPTAPIEAQARVDRIVARSRKMPQNQLAAQAERAPHDRKKVIILRELADNLGRAAAPDVPCKKGCNHCCHIPALVTPNEAKVIAEETGAYLAKPPLSIHADMSVAGTPCTFLTDQGCAIYAHRPYSCRIYYVVDRDSLLCEWVPGEVIKSAQLNALHYNMALARAFGDFHSMKFADIRAFFPKGLKR